MKEFPPFRLDIADQCLWRGEQRVPLTPKAFAVLRYLVERAGRLVTQNELLDAVWPDTFVQPEVLKSQILDVRTALGDRPKEPLFIETVPRRGYRFIAAVNDIGLSQPSVAEQASRKLVGRGDALEELRACLKRASLGERQILFITGEQGLGKTTLVEAFLDDLNSIGVHRARGQCLEGYGTVKEPYYPVLEALGHLSRGAGANSLAQILETHAPTWLIQLPALLKPEHRSSLQRELLGATRERMIRELCEALERLTEQNTLVLLFEDLHWADHSTVDLIAAVAHRRLPAKLLLIGTYRPIDLVLAQHPLRQASQSLKAHRLCRELTLSPLAEADVAEYLCQQAGAGEAAADSPVQALARWIRKQTDGNPLFMVTVIEHLSQLGHIALGGSTWMIHVPLDQIEVSVPDTLRQMIEVQIAQLTPREQLTLDAASVHGMTFSAAVTASALEMDAEGIEGICEKLAQQNYMVRTGEAEQLPDGTFSQRYEFVHAVFRNVFYRRLSPARRAKLHRKFGETLELLHAADRTQIAAELAGHFEQCAVWPRTVEYLELSAKNAWQRFDYREALAILEQALKRAGRLLQPERVEAEIRILLNISVLQHALHDVELVLPTLQALTERAAAAGKTEVEARALIALAALQASEDRRLSLPVFDRLHILISEEEDPFVRAQIRAQVASLRMTCFGWTAEIAEEHVACLDVVRASNDRSAIASLLLDRCFMKWATSRYEESLKSAQESLPALLESGRVVRYLHGRDFVATNLALLGRWGKALDILDESIENARKNEAPFRLAMPLVFKAWVHLHAADYQGVSDMCAIALPRFSGRFLADRRYIALRLAAAAELGLGNVDAAIERLLDTRNAIDRCPVVLSWYWRMPLQLNLADAYLTKGNVTQARIEADHALESTLRTASRTWQALAWELSARLAWREGNLPRAENDIKQGLDTIHELDVPLASWCVHATAARLAERNGSVELARRHLDSSRRIVQALADSLNTRPVLQQLFLSSPGVLDLGGQDLAHSSGG